MKSLFANRSPLDPQPARDALWTRLPSAVPLHGLPKVPYRQVTTITGILLHVLNCLADQFQKPSELFQELVTCVKSLLAMSLGIFKAIPVSLGKPCGRGEAKGGIMGSTSKIELGEPGRRSMRRLASTRRERAPTWLQAHLYSLGHCSSWKAAVLSQRPCFKCSYVHFDGLLSDQLLVRPAHSLTPGEVDMDIVWRSPYATRRHDRKPLFGVDEATKDPLLNDEGIQFGLHLRKMSQSHSIRSNLIFQGLLPPSYRN